MNKKKLILTLGGLSLTALFIGVSSNNQLTFGNKDNNPVASKVAASTQSVTSNSESNTTDVTFTPGTQTGTTEISNGGVTINSTDSCFSGNTYAFTHKYEWTFKKSSSSSVGAIKTIEIALDGALHVPGEDKITASSGTITTTKYKITWTSNETGSSKQYSDIKISNTYSTSMNDYNVSSIKVTYYSNFTVTFNNNGHGTAPSNQKVIDGNTVTSPGDLTATGYTFGGWFKESTCATAWNFSTDTVSTNTTIYAKWTAKSYNITYKDGGGTSGSTFSGTHESGYPTTHKYGTATTLKSASKTGYTFGGWHKEPACTTKIETLGATAYTDAITLYAKWTAKSYNINYKDQGGIEFSGTHDSEYPTTHTYGTTTNLKGATKSGYTFGGWHTDSACTTKIETLGATAYTDAITLYAKWTTTDYKITYHNVDGATHTNPYSYNIESETITLTDATKSGYTFGGWFSDSGFQTEIKTIEKGSTGDKDIYAKFTANTYNITYKDQGGIEFSGTHDSGYPTIHTYGTATTLKSASKTGYTFGGWHKEPACTTKIETLGATAYTDAITLYAKWNINSYTITWKNWDGMTLKTDSVEYGKLPSYTGEIPTKPSTAEHSYAFSGWSPAITTVTDDATYIAQFNETVNKYHVIYKNDDGTELQNTEVEYGSKIPQYSGAIPTKAPKSKTIAYEFERWEQVSNDEEEIVTGDTVYQAVFKEVERLYEIKFEMNGHGSQVQTLKVKFDGTIEEPAAPTADGLNFEGWYKDAAYTTRWNFATDKVEENTTLYAKWGSNNSAAKAAIIVGSSIGGAGLIGGGTYLFIRKKRKIKIGK